MGFPTNAMALDREIQVHFSLLPAGEGSGMRVKRLQHSVGRVKRGVLPLPAGMPALPVCLPWRPEPPWFHPQAAHAAAQGVWVDAQQPRGAEGAFDPSGAALQGGLDVLPG